MAIFNSYVSFLNFATQIQPIILPANAGYGRQAITWEAMGHGLAVV